jgi:phage shock protein A
MNATKIKLAEQAVAAHKARLASAGPDRDAVKRQIKAAEARLRDLRAGKDA